MSDWLDSFREKTERIRLETEEIKKETERLREENRKLRALSPEKLDEIVKNSTVDRLVINTTDNVGLPTYPNSILDVKGSLNSEDT